MKKFIVLLLLFGISFSLHAQKKFTFSKVSKDVKKETKKLEKEGWKIFPGNTPISQQLDNSYRKQAETDSEGFPLWIMSNGSSVAQTQAAAEMQALELAKNRLVSLIESNMKAVIESDVSTNQLDRKDAVSVTKTIEVSANRVSKKLGRVQPIVKIYRNVNKNVEVQVMIGYNYELVRKQILEEMKAELQAETDDVRKRYEKFLNPENYKKGEIKNNAE